METKKLLDLHRTYYISQATKSVDFRLHQLNTLRKLLQEHEQEFFDALKADFKKSEFETFATEIGLVLSEITYVTRNLKKWAKAKSVSGEIANFPSRNTETPEPYGTILIISPWNYPILLTLLPLIGAIAAGNTVVLKPSEISSHTSALLKNTFEKWFKMEYISVVEGGVEVSQDLLAQPFDYIFFTGSTEVGKIVMTAAAKNLTPVTLELGGKSPCIVDKTAELRTTAKRIVWGKFVNAGQTCVAPDYLLVENTIKPALMEKMREAILDLYGVNPKLSPDYPRIINDAHFERLQSYIDDATVFSGGKSDKQERYIEPTILDDMNRNDPVMNEEIFGPILPVVGFDSIQQAVDMVNSKPKPLALYLFTKDEKTERKVLSECSFGGGAINDTIAYLGNRELGFGGVGNSGMGSYYGKKSFDTFSHMKSVMKKPFWLDIPLRYPPYRQKLKWIKRILK